jgi:hypothetical protein
MDFFEDENISEFISNSSEYCTFLENTPNFSRSDFVKRAMELFSALYFFGQKLPAFELEEEAQLEKFVTELDWNTIYDKVKQKLGYHDEYLDLYDPVAKEEEELSILSLADNFADIYQDLKDFSTIYGIGNEDMMQAAVWELNFNFQQYWGPKLLNALRILHRLYYSEDIDLEEEEDEHNSGQQNTQDRNWLFDERKRQENSDL